MCKKLGSDLKKKRYLSIKQAETIVLFLNEMQGAGMAQQ